MALGVAANTIGKGIASTVFMCVCSMFRPSDFLLFVKNGFVVGARTLNVTAGHCKNAVGSYEYPIVPVSHVVWRMGGGGGRVG